jgi:HAD superfamily hydrolase (TIGR01490 family)
MNKKPVIAAFDFDGTMTTKDTLLEFIRFVKGTPAFLCGFALHFPLLLAYLLKLYPNWKVKQRLFSFFFKGMPLEDFNRFCDEFHSKFQSLLRPQAVDAVHRHIENGNSVVIVSASIENWVRPFAEQLNISSVLCTKLEINESQCLTGRFSTANCYSDEKVRRLLQLYPHRSDYFLIAYGDSNGDSALLDFADKKFYRRFV